MYQLQEQDLTEANYIGGYFVSGKELGRDIAGLTYSVLTEGIENSPAFGPTPSSPRHHVNYKTLLKMGIDPSRLPRRHGTAQHRPHAIGEISGRSRSRLLSIAATDRQRDLRAGLPQKTRATIQKKLAEDAAPAGIDAQHGRHLRPGDEHRRYPQSRPGHHARQDGRRTERQQPIPSARKLSDIFRSGGHIDFPCNFDGKNETGPRFQLRSHHDPEQNAVLRGPFRTVRRPQGAAFRPRYDDTGRGREKKRSC